jgi:hypothetical protein
VIYANFISSVILNVVQLNVCLINMSTTMIVASLAHILLNTTSYYINVPYNHSVALESAFLSSHAYCASSVLIENGFQVIEDTKY